MDLHQLSALLLAGRIISTTFIIAVLIRQWELFKRPAPKYVCRTRKILFLLVMVLLVGNIVPMTMNLIVLFTDFYPIVRPTTYGVIYTITGNITVIFASAIIWLMYKVSGNK